MKLSFTFFLALLLPLVLSSQESKVFVSLEKALKQPHKVYHLDLSRQRLKVFPTELVKFPNLISLDLSKNKISLIPAELGELQNLKELNLSRNKFSLLPPQIGKLHQLELLNLERNSISALPENFSNLESLKVLNMWKTDLKKFSDDFGKLENLEKIDVRGTIISDEEKERLKTILPNTDIHFTQGCYCGSGLLQD